MIYNLVKIIQNNETIIAKVKSKKELEKTHYDLMRKLINERNMDWNVGFTLMTKDKEEYSWFTKSKVKIRKK